MVLLNTFEYLNSSTCDLANASTAIPENLVSVIPDNTLLPVIERASHALSWFDPDALVNARTMWDTNSTPIPTHCEKVFKHSKNLLEGFSLFSCIWKELTTTRFTNDTAFSEIFHTHISPPIFTKIRVTIKATTIADMISNPVRTNVARNITNSEIPSENNVSAHIVKYCS